MRVPSTHLPVAVSRAATNFSPTIARLLLTRRDLRSRSRLLSMRAGRREVTLVRRPVAVLKAKLNIVCVKELGGNFQRRSSERGEKWISKWRADV